MKQFQKMVLLTMAVVFGLMGQADVYGISPSRCSGRNHKRSVYPPIQVQPVFKDKREDASLICSQNALCATLNGTFDYVYGQVGIYYHSPLSDGKNLFVPIYAMSAVKSSDNEYKVPKWDGKIFWLNVNPKYPPKPLQPQFIEEYPSGEKHISVKSAYYQKKDMDYTDYPHGAALCNIHVTADSNNQVTDYYLDVYDQDGHLLPVGEKLDIGDFINVFYSGVDDGARNHGLGIDDYVQVSQEPVFVYAGYIPGRDIGCPYCENQ